MLNKFRVFITFLYTPALAIAVLFCLATETFAETIIDPVDGDQVSFSISPDKERFLDPDFLFIDINLKTGGNNINALNLSLSFSSTSLTLVSTGTDASICSFVVNENIDNASGTYALQCGITPQISSDQTVTHLVFKKIKPGFTKLAINNNSAILAHDSLGSNLLNNREIHNIYIVK